MDGELLALDEFRNDELISEEELERQAARGSPEEWAAENGGPGAPGGRVERGYDARRAPPPVATGTGLNAVRQMKLTVTKKRSGKSVGGRVKRGEGSVGGRGRGREDEGTEAPSSPCSRSRTRRKRSPQNSRNRSFSLSTRLCSYTAGPGSKSSKRIGRRGKQGMMADAGPVISRDPVLKGGSVSSSRCTCI